MIDEEGGGGGPPPSTDVLATRRDDSIRFPVAQLSAGRAHISSSPYHPQKLCVNHFWLVLNAALSEAERKEKQGSERHLEFFSGVEENMSTPSH